MVKMRVLDLFSGIGGFSLGLERSGGFETVAFVEIDPYCRRVLAKHWPAVPVYGDIRELTGAQVLADAIDHGWQQQRRGDMEGVTRPTCGEGNEQAISIGGRGKGPGIDLICGGFPCQDISVAGKGVGIGGERSGLWSEYARIIGEIRPRYVIVENVAALLVRGMGRVLGDLSALGYDAEWQIISAADVGAPHLRRRVWIVAYPNGSQLRHQPGRRSSGTNGSGQTIAGDDGAQGDVAHAARGIRQWPTSGQAGHAAFCCEDVSHANGQPAQRIAIAWGECGHWRTEPDVRGISDGLSPRLDGDLNGRDRMGSAAGSSGKSETRLRDVWLTIASRPASQGSGSDEQLTREFANAVPELSHALALGRGQDALAAASIFLHRLREACAALGALRNSSDSLQAAWQCLSQEEAEGAFLAACGRADWRSGEWLGAPRVAHGVRNRVDRLRSLGNTVVPQIPEIIGRAILKAEAAASYDGAHGNDDFAKSYSECLAEIRARIANGGPGWGQ